MFPIFLSLVFLNFTQGQKPLKPKKDLETEDDRRFLKESVAKYGPPQLSQLYDLPGPEIDVHETELTRQNLFRQALNNFTHRFRAKTKYFSYNGRYETTYTKTVSGKEIVVVKGQVSEEFPRKFGGFYVRTIGYVFDENGFRTFLIDISKIVTPNSVQPKPSFTYSMAESRGGFLEGTAVPVLKRSSTD